MDSAEREFAGQLVSAMLAQTYDTTNRLVDSLRHSWIVERTANEIIRAQVLALVVGDYMPTPKAILAALVPDPEEWRLAIEDMDNDLKGER